MEGQTEQSKPTPPSGGWSGAIALVTGATGGIGKEIARQLLTAGLVVYVCGRDMPRAQCVAAEMGEGARPCCSR